MEFIIITIIIILISLLFKKFISSKVSTGSSQETPFNSSEIYTIASTMTDFFNNSAHPKDLLESDQFKQGVNTFIKSDISYDQLLGYCFGENVVISCMAFEALNQSETDDIYIEKIINNLQNNYLWSIYYALRNLEYVPQAVVGKALANAREWWSEYKILAKIFDDFIGIRISQGENPSFDNILSDKDPNSIYNISQFLNQLDISQINNLYEELKQINATLLDTSYLNSVGRFWSSAEQKDIIIEHDYLLKIFKQTEELIFKSPSRSVLLVGEPGVGKSALINHLANSLEKKGWKIFEAASTDILAGQVYIGELEARIQNMVQNLDSKRRVIWYIPNFHQLHYAGRHRYSPISVLDMVLPFVENGMIKIIGETHPASNEKLSTDNKRVHTALEIIRIDPLEDEPTLELVKKWTEKSIKQNNDININENTLIEALHLSKQFLNDKEAPGNLFNLVKIAQRQIQIDGTVQKEISKDDLYTALSQITGLPRSMLDDQEGLDLNNLRENFRKRVLGQNEAIESLVERVAMIKAGLTDPTRPFGVFLFAGPTGTGKTEIAKTLADFLFGSSERMIRLDMSEFTTIESVDRILGETNQELATSALVNQIRKQPFSVILLDEFEKAHDNIWNLFLQVFDDGRLTDKKGNTSDFRHTIIIMTSNLGATIQAGTNLGFTSAGNGFSQHLVEKAIAETFRREFVNRIDRVVIFRPLSRSIMRNIMYNELNLALQRRGLRNRDWAVEWEDSAIDFLLEKGFTPDLGARPLKRAIERYLLSPLAITIVNHQFPSGDQFLFVKSDGKEIHVEFIDPDGNKEDLETESEDQETITAHPDSELTLKKIMLDPKGNGFEVAYLRASYIELENSIHCDKWQESKSALLNGMSQNGFWESPERFRILSEAEYMDRIESGLKTADSLTKRVESSKASKNVIVRLAQQLYLLNEAYNNLNTKTALDVFVKITSTITTGKETEKHIIFAEKIKNMYLNWAKLRYMKYTLLSELKDMDSHKYTAMIAFSGFGSYSILEPENGLHIFEEPEQDNRYAKINVQVQVEPQPQLPANNPDELFIQAKAVFDNSESKKRVIRHYREQPSPLVKDTYKKWRTGRINKVMGGNFDLFS